MKASISRPENTSKGLSAAKRSHASLVDCCFLEDAEKAPRAAALRFLVGEAVAGGCITLRLSNADILLLTIPAHWR